MYQNINKIYHAAIYVRLSKEDGDISSSAKLESNSISNQKALILDFLKDKKDIEVVSVRVDDGYSGSNFERPAFQAMLEDIRRGIVDCVVVKDLSRFGREYIDSGKYIERLFPALGVRFIAIRNHNFYTGKIWCGGCGNRMTLSRERNGTFFYICGANTNHKSGGKQCKGHRVRKEYVDDDVLRLIQTHMKTVLDTEKMIQEMNTASKNQTQYLLLDKEVGKLRRELSRISKRKSDLYEDYSERLITEEEYIQFSRIYSNEIENIKSRLDTVLAAQVRYSQDYHIEEGWGNVIHTYMSKRKLTKEMADAFVDSIIIHGKYDYEIKLVYDDQFADLQKLKKEKEAQTR